MKLSRPHRPAPGSLRHRLASGVMVGLSGATRVLVALFAGLASVAAAGSLTGLTAPPAEAEALAVAGIAVAHSPGNVPGSVVRCDYWCPEWDGHEGVVAYDGPADRTDFVRIVFRQPRDEAVTVVTRAHERLAAAGWRLDPDGTWAEVRRFEATGDGMKVSVGLEPDPRADGLAVQLLVSKGFSAPALAAMVAAFGGGIVAGWVAAGWAFRRGRRQSGTVQTAMLITGVPMVLATALTAGGMALLVVASIPTDGWSPKLLQLPTFLFSAFPRLTIAGIAVTVATLALAALPIRSAPAVGHTGAAR